MLRQSYAEKQLLERITGYKFEPLLVFSNAWLIGNVPAKRDGVTMIPSRMLAWFISNQRPVVTPQRAREVYDQLVGALAGGISQSRSIASGPSGRAVIGDH
jgi:hypothetical protein